MKYLDTGSRDPEQALAKWLETLDASEVEELRIQSGFFSIGGIGLLLPIFAEHVEQVRTTRILIGSNDGGTLRSDVLGLAGYMGIPRENASLGVVNFGNAYFHPKTYHVRRSDGSQVAYVGSANLSAAGLALHVEAGVSLDTRENDKEQHLSAIAMAIDAWFIENRDGLHLIEDIESVDNLVAAKVLAAAPKPRPTPSEEKPTSSSASAKPGLKPIVDLPPVKMEAAPSDDEPQENQVQDALNEAGFVISPAANTALPQAQTSAPAGATNKAVPKNGFPQYLLFDPGATAATAGAAALTGTALPSAAVGLIVQLNLDSARHFMGGKGTANISIPIATIGTIRFGIFGVHARPRAEFPLEYRYVSASKTFYGGPVGTNIQGYGYTATESGHVDIRMLVPADIRAFGDMIKKAGLPVPTNGNFAFLEWPTMGSPVFRLTFLEPASGLATNAGAAFATAVKSGEVVGQGACWLPSNLSPTW